MAIALMHLSLPYLLPLRVRTHTTVKLPDAKVIKQRLVSHFALLAFFFIG